MHKETVQIRENSTLGRLRMNFKFKTSYNNDTVSIRNKGHEKKTELSKHVCKLKDKGEDFTIKRLLLQKDLLTYAIVNAVTYA